MTAEECGKCKKQIVGYWTQVYVEPVGACEEFKCDSCGNVMTRWHVKDPKQEKQLDALFEALSDKGEG